MNSNGFHYGSLTQSAGTKIVRTVPYRKNRIARITTMRYRSGATAHTVTPLVSLGTTTLSAGASAAQADVVLTADPAPAAYGPPASGDYVTFQKPDGGTFQSTVSAWNAGTKTMTLVDNVPTGGLASGANMWFHGVAGDQTANQFTAPASVTTSFTESDTVGVAEGGVGEPIVAVSDNATNAGVLEQVSGIYANR